MATVYDDKGNARIGVSSDAYHVVDTISGETYSDSREKNAVTTSRVSFTWLSPIREVDITVLQESTAVLDSLSAIAFCFDAPSDAVADAWLISPDSGSINCNRVLVASNGIPRNFKFASPGITRIDAIRVTGIGDINCTVSIEAS